MSGGVAYVLDEKGVFNKKCNKEMVELQKLEDKGEIKQVREMIEKHLEYTGSKLAERVLQNWDEMLPLFVKVMPKDYEKMLKAIKKMQDAGLSGDEALLAAFEENKGNVSLAEDDD
jgi:glutamate synthase (ferredoxin)